MITANLRNVGGSVMMAIPKTLLEGLGLSANSKVDLSMENGRLIVDARRKPRYTLTDLLAQCDMDAKHEDDTAWQEAGPVGREIL